MSTEKRSFLHDAASVLGTRVFLILASLATGVILARQLGPAGKGILAALLVYPQMLMSLAELGIRQATVHQLGEAEFARKDIVSTVSFLLVVSSAVAVLLCGAAFVALENPDFTLPRVAAVLVIIPVLLIRKYASGIFLGMEQIGSFNRVKGWPAFIELVAVVGLVWGAGMYVEGALVAKLLGGLVVAGYAARVVAQSVPVRPRLVTPVLRKMLRKGVVYAVALFFIGLNYKLDIALLEHLGASSEVGHYSVGVGVAQKLWLLPAALGTVVFSRSANASDGRKFSRSVAKLVRVTLLAALLGAGALFVLADPVIPFVFGDAFAPSVPVVQLLLPGIVLIMLFKVLNMDLAGKGRPVISLGATVPAIALNIGLNILWIPSYGAAGAAVASTLSYALATMVFVFLYSRIAKVGLRKMFTYRKSDFAFVSKRIAEFT